MKDIVKNFFDYSPAQSRVLIALAVSATILSVYLVLKTHGRPTITHEPLSAFLGSPERKLTGLFVLDPNTSPPDSLELLPGIGRVLADRIVARREEKPFRTEIEITEVQGIGPKLYESIKPFLRVRR